MATSRSLNKVILIGNLTRDPVLKKTTGGATVCTFGIATNATWRNESGELQERTEFHNVVAWNKLAEICAQLLSVGMLVYVEGELRTRSWDDDAGVRHYQSEIRISDMKLLDNKGKSGVGIENAKTESNEEKDENEKKENNKNQEKGNNEKKEELKKDEEKKDEVAPEDLAF